MTNGPNPKKAELISVVPGKISEAITAADEALFDTITATRLSEAQQERIATPPRILHQQASVLAIHWHPEFVPMSLIGRRIEAM